jgi:hypothetical protein
LGSECDTSLTTSGKREETEYERVREISNYGRVPKSYSQVDEESSSHIQPHEEFCIS